MLFHLSLVVLGPVYIWQGKQVRRNTPELPEPQGARSGLASSNEASNRQLSVLIAGDSSAAGVGVDVQQQALSGQLVASLAKTHRLDWTLWAKTGDRSADLLDRLQQANATDFDIAVLAIGVNDVTKLTSVKAWLDNIQAIVELLQNKFSVKRIYFSCLPPMHLFPALPQPLRWWLGSRARHFNKVLQRFALGHSGCEFVESPFDLDVSHMASDGFHPGAPAYKTWGEYMAHVIRERD